MIVDKLKSKMLEYMKNRDTLRLGVVRYFLAQVKNKEIELRPQGVELKEKHVGKALEKEVKKRKEAIEIAQGAGREDIVEKESAELGVLEEFKDFFTEYEFK